MVSHPNCIYVTSNLFKNRRSFWNRQTSDSYAHDGGGQPKLTSIPATLDSRRLSRISSDKSSYKNQPFSPGTMASSDVSLSSLGSNNPSSPPPRYRRVSSDQATEVWYAKWWMCGFTDALNINSNSWSKRCHDIIGRDLSKVPSTSGGTDDIGSFVYMAILLLNRLLNIRKTVLG